MKSFKNLRTSYQSTSKLNSLVDIKPIEELKFRLYCIKHKDLYETEGYGDISSLENFLYQQIQKRKNVDTTLSLIIDNKLDYYTTEELRDELEMNKLISESYYCLLKTNK